MDAKIQSRVDELGQIGLVYNKEQRSFIGKDEDIKDFNVSGVEVMTLSDEDWRPMIDGLKSELTKRRSPSILKSDEMAIISTASEVLQRNQIAVSKAKEVGEKIIEAINQGGMNDVIDEKCNNYLVNAAKAVKAMNERRSPITQLFNQVVKQFTSLEGEMKDGQTVKIIQQHRNNWAAKKAEEKRKADAEVKRKLDIANEKVRIRKDIELKLVDAISTLITSDTNELITIFNSATLEKLTSEIAKINAFSSILDRAKYDDFEVVMFSAYLNASEIEEIKKAVLDENYETHSKRYWEAIDDLKINLVAKETSRRNELERIAETERQQREAAEKAKQAEIDRKNAANEQQRLAAEEKARQAEIDRLAAAAEQERLNQVAAERQKQESEKQQAEQSEQKRKAETQTQTVANAATLENLFSATEQTSVVSDSKGQSKASLKITVTHPAGWVLVFQTWFENEGNKLTIDEAGKRSLNQMKAWCEKYSTKTGDLIDSKYIKYEEDIKAVNK